MTSILPGTKPAEAIARDRYGRPLITPPGGTKPKGYTRVSTMAKTLDDNYNLQRWACRMTAKGLAERPDLYALAQSTPFEDRATLNDLVEQATEAAGNKVAANIGTAIHSFCEAVDLGQPLSEVPDTYRPHVAAYRAAIEAEGFQVVTCEQFVVNDDLECAGTLDRLYLAPGSNPPIVVGDLKTGGDPKFYALATAMQVAIYARSSFYDLDTQTRTPLPVNLQTGFLVHVPQDNPAGTAIYELDLDAGWNAALLAYDVRRTRATKVHKAL